MLNLRRFTLMDQATVTQREDRNQGGCRTAILGNWPGNGKRVGFELHQHPGVLRRPAQESDQAFAWGLRSGDTQIIQSNQSPQQTDIPSVVLTGIVLIWRGFKARQAAVKSIAASCRHQFES